MSRDPKFDEYVEHIDNIAYKYNMSVTGESPETLRVDVAPDTNYPNNETPSIRFSIELDSDGESDYIYFMPIVSFPTLDSLDLSYADTIQYLLQSWADDIGGFCKEIIQNPYIIDNYDMYEEE